MRNLIVLIACAFLVVGCSSPQIALPPYDGNLISKEVARFEPARSNRYAVLLKGAIYEPTRDRFIISNALDMPRAGRLLQDEFVNSDIDALAALLASKHYMVQIFDMAYYTPEDVAAHLLNIRRVANEDTNLFMAYSGEGRNKFLMTRAFLAGPGQLVTTADTVIEPIDFIKTLALVPGHKALLLNACESGVFAQAALNERFQGVVIAACAPGFATTPNEPSGHSAIFAAFLNLYRDDSVLVKNLATTKIEKAGDGWTNFRHKWADFWGGGGLPISYEPIVYAGADFLF